MDRQSLHDLLDAATGLEPPTGAIPQNALRAGLRLRRRRRARYASTSAAAIAVACAAALAVASGIGRQAATPGPETVYVLGDAQNPATYQVSGLVTPIPAATDRAGPPVTVARSVSAMQGWPMVVSPDGTIWATDGNDTVTAISATTHKAEKTITVGHGTNDVTQQLLVSPDGKTLYVLDSAGTVTPISTATLQPGTPINVGPAPLGDEMAITPDGRTLYVLKLPTQEERLPGVKVGQSAPPASYVFPVDTATGRHGAPIRVATYATEIVVTPDGRTAYVVGQSPSGSSIEVTPIATATNKPARPVALGPDVDDTLSDNSPLMAPDGRTMYFFVDPPDNGPGPSGVLPFSTVTNTPGKMISLGHSVYPLAMAITPDGRTIYVVTRPQSPGPQCSQPGKAVVPVSTVTGTVGNPIHAGCQPADVAISPDGSMAYIASAAPDTNEGSMTAVPTSTNEPGKTVSIASSPIQIVVAP
jgi:DNA-binding beta-propeller fold protein YncE